MIAHKAHHGQSLNLSWHSSIGIDTKIFIGQETLRKLADIISQINAGKRILLLKQPNLFIEQIDNIKAELHGQGISVHVLEIPNGETCKSSDCLLTIWGALHEFKFARQDTIIALGGGTVTDIAGFAASTYLRGINLISIPTTLLAQVDAAIGGKTAINFQDNKNMAGTFYFAKAIIVDTDTLATLPKNELISGMSEIIKYSLIEKTIANETEYVSGPKLLLEVLQEIRNGLTWNNVLLPSIIATCIKLKLSVVAKDPLENGLRRCLNLGHTLGHALETASNFQLNHGQAVAIGMAFAFHVALSRSQISQADQLKALSLIKAFALPINIPKETNTEILLDALFRDKKRAGQGIKMVLPTGSLGQIDYQSLIKEQEIEQMLSSFYQQ